MAGKSHLTSPPQGDEPTLPPTDGDHVASATAWIPGTRYTRLTELGRGASKRVHLAHDTLLDREVAVAIVAGVVTGSVLQTRLLREVRTTSRLGEHAHIVTVHDVGEQEGIAWIVSQYVRGGSVSGLMAASPAGVPIADAVRICAEVADALSFAHARGVVHRDVKPGNVLLDEDGSALLADFGVALLTDGTRVTSEGIPIGTATFMPPEQVRGDPADGRSDLYALGAMLFELVCGRPPFRGDPLAVMAQQLNRPPPDPRSLNPEVDVALAELILRLLRKRPEERPPRADAVAASLRALGRDPATGPASRLAPPVPRALRTDPRRPFVGRDEALGALRRAWAHSADGWPGLAIVSGEAGIGKTRLATAFAEELAAAGALVLHGRCDEDALVSYQPVIEALRDLVAHRPDATEGLDARWAPELAELGQLVPELRGRLPDAVEGERRQDPQRYLLFDAVVALLTQRTAQEPLLLVVDDLQWADRPTALLLRHLLRSTPPGAVMVLATLRTEDTGAAEDVAGTFSELSRIPGDPERLAALSLGGLAESESRALVDARYGEVDPSFLRALRERTGGNPFFIEEVLRGLGEVDLTDPGQAAAALDSAGVPSDVAVVIRQRLRRLSPGTVELLTLASVCGREFRPDVLTAIGGIEAGAVVAHLEEATAAGLVLEQGVGRYTFRHALVRETVGLGMTSATRRARVHLSIGAALEQLDGDDVNVAELALHFHAAREVGGAERAARHALGAARAALQALAYEVAAAFQIKAIDALEALGPDHDAERCRTMDALGQLQWRAGDQAGAQETFVREAELARRLGDTGQLARAALGYAGRSYEAETIDPTLNGLLQEALDRVPAGETALRAKLMGRLAEALHPVDGPAADRLSVEALALARRAGDPAVLVVTLAGRHMALLHAEHLQARLELGAEWLGLTREAGSDDEVPALQWRAYDMLEAGDADAMRSTYARLEERAEQLRQPLYRHFALAWRAKLAHMAGRFEEAEGHARESYRAGRRAQGGHVALLYAGQLYGIRRDQGRLGELAGEVGRLVGRDPTLPVWRAGMIAARAAAGDLGTARAQFAALLSGECEAIPRDMFWLAAMCLLGEGAVALGDADAGARLTALLEPYADRHAQVGLAFYLGPVRGFLGELAALLGDERTASEHLAAALQAAESVGGVTAGVRLRAAYGRLLAHGDRPEDRQSGRELLEASARDAEDLGMAPARGMDGLAR